MKSIAIALVDDDPIFCDLFKKQFNSNEEISFLFHAESIKTLLSVVSNEQNLKLDYLFLDIYLAEENSIASVPKLVALLPTTEIIMLTVDENPNQLLRAIKAGASGYLVKKNNMESIPDYIRIAQQGGAMMSAEVALTIFREGEPFFNEINNLTEKEIQVLNLLSEGWSYKLIADKIDLSIHGVRYYIKQIYRKLNVNSKGEAINLFYHSPIIEPAEAKKRGRPSRQQD